MQDALRFARLSAHSQAELPQLWLHPVHMKGTGPTPRRFGASSAPPTNIQDLQGVAVTAVKKFNAAFGFRDWRWRNEHRISFGGPGLIIHASDENADSSWSIPLRSSEVTHFRTQAGTLFLSIGLRKVSEQPRIEDFSGPFEEYWVVGVSNNDEFSQEPLAALPQLLTMMGALGAVRSDLHESYDIANEAVGTGGCGSVHLGRARDPAASKIKDIARHEDRVVAIKIPTAESSYLAAKEAGFLMGWTGHRNIIAFYGLFKVPDPASDLTWRWAIMMDYCSGGDLNDFVAANGPCSELRSVEIMFGLLSALSYLHTQGIVHRDVKSENILMEQGRPVLADFGIAAYLDDAEAMAKRCGSPGHCAPEILESKQYNANVDVFSSGVVFYFLVSKFLPFRGPDLPSVLRRTAKCKVVMDEGCFRVVSSKLKSLIKLFLRRDPSARPESSAALHEIILAYGKHLRASSLLLDCATDASKPADKNVAFVDGAASPLDTEDWLGQPSFSSVGVLSHSNDEDMLPGRGTCSSRRDTFTPLGTSYTQASEDPSNSSDGQRLSFYQDLIMTDGLATRAMQGQLMNKRRQCSKEMRQRSKCLSSDTSDMSVLDEIAAVSTGDEQSGLQWSSQSRDLPRRPLALRNFRRRFPISSVSSDGKRPHAENARLDNTVGLDHQADNDSSTASCGWVPHAPPPDTEIRTNRRLVPLFRRRLGLAKYKQTNTFVADRQGMTPRSCGSEVAGEETSAASENERSAASWRSSVSTCRPTGKFFNDDDGAHFCFDNAVLEDSTPQQVQKDSLVSELLSSDGACSKLKLPKPSLPRGIRGLWQQSVSVKKETPRQSQPTYTSS